MHRHSAHRRLLFALLIFVPVLSVAQSQDWAAINRDILAGHVMPAYEALARAGRGLSEVMDTQCQGPDEAGLAEMRLAWHDAMDAWQSIQHVRFGPVTYFNWQYRLQYWPDERGTGNRQLSALIAAADPAMLEQEVFSDQSVGVQGLPALESLLFGEDSQALQEESYRCRLARTIADNIAGISSDILVRWENEFRHTLLLEDDSGWFMDHSDATTELLKALVETIPILTDQKLALPMGESAERFRLRRAESWRSSRSLRNIRRNVAALYELYAGQEDQTGLSAVFGSEHVTVIDGHFADVRRQLDELPDSLEVLMSSSGDGYAHLVKLRTTLDALYEALEAAVKDTELYLGFNSLDGD